MTTIAASVTAGLMAADSKVTWDGPHNPVGWSQQKVFRLPNREETESLYGLQGDSFSDVFIEWVKKGFSDDARPQFPEGEFGDVDFSVLELSPTGLYLWDKYLTRYKLKDATFATGSGQKIALYCMRQLGHEPRKAVLEASTVDPYTAPPIDWMNLDGSEGTYEG